MGFQDRFKTLGTWSIFGILFGLYLHFDSNMLNGNLNNGSCHTGNTSRNGIVYGFERSFSFSQALFQGVGHLFVYSKLDR